MRLLAFTMTRINGEVPKVRYHGMLKSGTLAECFEMLKAAKASPSPR